MSLVKPISVGPVTIEAPVILAPMTGVTDLPFRKIVKRYGAGLTVSEMIASQAMIRETRQSLQNVVKLYESGDRAEPNASHAAKAAEWRARVK